MELLDFQRELLSDLYFTQVYYESEEAMKGNLGYALSGRDKYEIHILSDLPKDVKKVVLIHEAGHIKLGHCSKSRRFKESIEKVFEDSGNNHPMYADLRGELQIYTKPQLINICMDMEINQRYFTMENIKVLKDFEFCPYTYTEVDLEYCEDFFGYLKEYLKVLTPRKPPETGASNTAKTGDVTEAPDKFEGSESENLGESFSEEGVEPLENREDFEFEEFPNGYGSNAQYSLKEQVNPEDEIIRFIKSLYKTERLKNYDSLKHYNRGTRANRDGVIYTSTKNRMKRHTMDLMVIIDVSGSMSTTKINMALSSLKQMVQEMGSQTIIVHWGSVKIQEYSIKDIDKVPKKSTMSGISYNCLEYAKDSGFKNVLLYSDMCDDGRYSFKSLSKDLNVYSIIPIPKTSVSNHKARYPEVWEYSKRVLFIDSES